MRLWHYDLLPYLPKQQLISQWRELNSIYVKQNKHILINFIYEYDKKELLIYSQLVLSEMNNRGYKFNLKNYYKFFKEFDKDDLDFTTDWLFTGLFENHMNYTYLKICCWNLLEKDWRGQKGFTHESLQYIRKIAFNPRFV